jgi:hypothetical protein
MKVQDLYGSGSLQRTYKRVKGIEHEASAFHTSSYGYIHYLDDGRVAVLIAHDRRPLSGDRRNSPEREMSDAARSFDAYGGTFSLGGNIVTHHLDISSYENDRGADYVCYAPIAGNYLKLEMSPIDSPEGKVTYGLEWMRMRPASMPGRELGRSAIEQHSEVRFVWINHAG